MLTLLPMPLAEAEPGWEKLCKHWGVEAENSQPKVELLRHISTAAMLDFSLGNQMSMLPPVAEGQTMAQETVAFPHVDLRRETKPVGYEPIEVMIGTTDVESAGHFRNADVDLKELQEAFIESYPTAEAGAQVLEAYGLVEGAEHSALRARRERLHSDIIFDLGVYRARTGLSAQRHANHGDVTSIQPYHIEFGNPFPGTKRGRAHHCVDLIYMFDPFHDALVDADKGIFKRYPESSAEPPGDTETQPTEQKATPSSETPVGDHLSLLDKYQDHVISFIVGKPLHKVREDEILVWGKDGSSRVERLAESPRWTERIAKLRLLEEDLPSLLKALRGF